MKSYFVYIITNKSNNVLYIGVTNNLARRVLEHKSKTIPGFSAKYNLTKLVYFEEFSSKDDAISNEKKLKGWLRKKKLELIESRNPNWADLSLGTDPSLCSG
jgi:putative endonuclease